MLYLRGNLSLNKPINNFNCMGNLCCLWRIQAFETTVRIFLFSIVQFWTYCFGIKMNMANFYILQAVCSCVCIYGVYTISVVYFICVYSVLAVNWFYYIVVLYNTVTPINYPDVDVRKCALPKDTPVWTPWAEIDHGTPAIPSSSSGGNCYEY